MKALQNTFILLLIITVSSCKSEVKDGVNEKVVATSAITEAENIVKVNPINHGTLVLESNDYTFYIDPVGGAEKFKNQKKADIVLITDIHGDHLNLKTLENLDLTNATLIAPKAVVEKLNDSIAKTVVTLNNGDSFNPGNVEVEAIPMYNLREEALKFHPKGRGNGYVINVDGQRIYISGDTEDIPEMRQLKNIDKAFVCMNLPYTMPIESAASAVLDFKPKTVYPYHYRGTEGFSDVEAFKKEINTKNPDINVMLLGWYN